jgi:hypothetical protein
MTIRQTRKGWIQECFGCEAADEFKWINTTDGASTHIATSLEESNFCMRLLCGGCHEFTMDVKEEGSGDTIMSMHRPMACNAAPCKCCCFNTMTMTSNSRTLGSITEGFYCCVPRMSITNSVGATIYKVHQPTCCGGICVNCCAEGRSCGAACCRVPFHIFPGDMQDTDNGAPHVGKILKVPKSLATEIFTDSEAFDVDFPVDATVEQKALIAASSVYINANFFESEKQGIDV